MWEKRHCYFFDIPEFVTYDGDEVKVKWVGPEEIALSTGDKEFPFRVLQRRHIIEINDKPYNYSTSISIPKIRSVKGSGGKTYQVTGNYKCTCQGFTFRGTCKHLEMA